MNLAERLAVALADRYRLGAELGRGGSAVVFRAKDLKHDREVAIKVLHPELTATLTAERFLREIASTARLSHPHILPLLDSGSADGLLYFVTPYLAGETLRERLRREGQLPIADVIRIVTEIADGLSAAHEQRIIHRDIKPDNVLTSGRHVVIADFGVARATSASLAGGLTAGLALGTPSYMSPEQASASPGVDHRSDLYALGVLGYELLTGHPPFRGETPQDTLTAHLCQPPEPIEHWRPDVPPVLAGVVMRCLAKSPNDRFASAADIVAVLDPLTTPSDVTPAAWNASPVPRRRWGIAALGGLALLAAVIWQAARSGARPAGNVVVTQQMVTFSGDVEEVALSPNGEMLALVQRQGDGRRVVVTARDGGSQVELARGGQISDLRWLADGRRVAYSVVEAGTPRLLVIPFLGGPATAITNRRAALSPDGRTAAIVSYSGREVAFARLGTDDTVRVDFRASGVPPWALQMAWAPTGDRVAVMATPGNRLGASFVVARATGGPPEVFPVDSVAVHGFTWTPRGDTLLLLVQRGSVAGLDALPIRSPGSGRLTTVAGGLPGTLLRSDGATNLTISRDGRLLAYAPLQTVGNAVVARVAGGHLADERPLTRGTALHDRVRLSPDGRTIATVRREAGVGVTVGLVGLDGGPVTDLTRLDDATDLAWSPDGQLLAVVGTRLPEPPAVFLVDRAGLVRRVGSSVPLSDQVAWRDSTTLLLQSQDNRRFFALTLGPRPAERTLVEGGSGWVFDLRYDARRGLAFYWNRGASGQGVWWRPDSIAAPRPVARTNGVLVGWSRDGAELVVAVRRGESDGRLMAYRLVDGAGRLLAPTPEGFVVDEVAPDLVTVVGHRLDRRGDALIVERR